MNILRLITKPTEDPCIFNVYWTNTIQSPRGIVRVRVPDAMEDKGIVAELYALQYLLEVAEVIGADLAGNPNSKLIVSFGAIKKLSRMSADKRHLVEFATFLITRFKGCPIEVDKKEKWLEGVELAVTHELYADKPIEETVFVHSLGDAHLTSHVVERLAERLSAGKDSPVTLGTAWRMLRNLARQECVKEVDKNNPKTKIKYALKGRAEGRYFLNSSKNWMFVVTDGKFGKTLATAYPITEEFSASLK